MERAECPPDSAPGGLATDSDPRLSPPIPDLANVSILPISWPIGRWDLAPAGTAPERYSIAARIGTQAKGLAQSQQLPTERMQPLAFNERIQPLAFNQSFTHTAVSV